MNYYDHENRLTIVRDQSDNFIVSYGYDWMGRRAFKVYDDVVTSYVYDGDNIIAEYEDGVLKRKYVHGPGIDEPVRMTVIGESQNYTYYYHFDGLGSVAALTNSSGYVVEKYRYDAFGATTILAPDDSVRSVSSVANRFMFTGREWDYETGNYYYRARYYKPEIGRFLQTDPIGYYDSMNLYQYCGNNPINWIDPWGFKHYSYAETRAILAVGRMRGTLSANNPLGWHEGLHFGPTYLGGYDYKGTFNAKNDLRKMVGLPQKENTERDTFQVSEKGCALSDSEFGNYIAGYLARWHRGTAGHVFLAGRLEHGSLQPEKDGSEENIQMGIDDAIADRQKYNNQSWPHRLVFRSGDI